MLHQQIKEDLKTALKEKDEVKTGVLRSMMSAFTNELISQKKDRDEHLEDEKALEVIQKLAKQHKDSIEQFEQGGRDDLVETEKKELEVIESYLPQMMSKDEIEEAVKQKAKELGISDKSRMGDLMGAVMGELKGKAEGKDVKEVVEQVISE